jgi:transcriptional regulator with XRE-family HTH domain
MTFKEYRRAAGFTQSVLAEKSGVAEVTIKKYEALGALNPESATLHKLAVALGCDMYDLFDALETAAKSMRCRDCAHYTPRTTQQGDCAAVAKPVSAGRPQCYAEQIGFESLWSPRRA